MCVSDRHDMTLAVKGVLNPNTTNQHFSVSNVHIYYPTGDGDRKLSIIKKKKNRIRNKSNDLGSDLLSKHISVSTTCTGGHRSEDAEHYIFSV